MNKNENLNLGNFCCVLADIFTKIIDSLSNREIHKINFDEFIKTIEEFADDIIISSVKKDKLIYIGGEVLIKCTIDGIMVDIEWYFNDMDKKWVQKKMINSIKYDKFTEETIKIFEKEKKFVFTINNPL